MRTGIIFLSSKKYYYSDSLYRNEEPNYTLYGHNKQCREVSKMLYQLLSSMGHGKLILMFFQGILSNITTSWIYSRK